MSGANFHATYRSYQNSKLGVMTNHGIEINKKKDGFERNGVLDFIVEREKKRWGL